MSKKIFTEKQVNVAAFLGGPIPPGILLYKNYKAFGKNQLANNTLVASIIFTALFFYGLLQLPQEILDKIPNAAFSALYTLMVFLFFRRFMKEEVDAALAEGVTKGSNWSVAGFTILGLLLNLAIILGFAIDQPLYDGERLVIDGNDLYYDNEVPLEDVNLLAKRLQADDFFGSEYGNTARIEAISVEYYITLLVDQELWNDESTMSYVENLKFEMGVTFNRPVNLKLESLSLSGTSTFKYITD